MPYVFNPTTGKLDYYQSTSGDAPKDATYITQTPNATLTNEQALSLLASGYMKNTTVTGVISIQTVPIPVTDGGSGTTSAFTQGSVIFAGVAGAYSQDNTNFFWDATNHYLGIGTATPGYPIDISKDWGNLSIRMRNPGDPTGSNRQAGMDFGFSDARRVTFAVASDSGVGAIWNGKAYFYSTGNPNGLSFQTADNTPIEFMTQAIQRMVIQGGGNVNIINSAFVGGNFGVGTVTPASLVQAIKNQNASTVSDLTNTNAGASAYTAFSTTIAAGGITYFGMSPAAGFSGGNAFIYTSNGAAITFWPQGVEKVRITSTGQFGVGVTAPVSLFANTATNSNDGSQGISTLGLAWLANGAGYAGSFTQSSSSGQGLLVNTTSTSATARVLYLRSNSVDRFIVNGDGKVGIGLNNPVTLFANTSTNPIDIDGFGAILASGFSWTGSSSGYIASYASTQAGGANGNGVLIQTASNASTARVAEFEVNGVSVFTVTGPGRAGFGVAVPTAVVHIKAGTATASTAPLKLTAGTNNTTPESGAFEFDGAVLTFTI